MPKFSYPDSIRSGRGFQPRAGAASLLLASAGFLAGCGGGTVFDTARESAPGVELQGIVHGGQQPVSGATIQLYAAQASGYAATSVKLITGTTVTTKGDGSFNITSDYMCPSSPNDQVYLVATGGSSGAGTNSNLALMTALGSCSTLSSSTVIAVNEVTTVASAYALSGFMADYAHVGTSSNNYTGLVNAMATVNNLVNTSTGQALAVTPAYQTVPTGYTAATFASTVPQAEVNTLANIIAACVNNGVSGAPSTSCTSLFGSNGTNTITGGAPGVPDTIQAALNIAKNPGSNVAALFTLASSKPPFPSPALTTAPNDWTIELTFTGGGLGGAVSGTSYSAATDLAVDGLGNVWVANQNTNTVTELNNLGAPQSPNMKLTPFIKGGFTNSAMSAPTYLAVDTNNNIFVGNENNAKIIEFNNAGGYVRTISGGGLTSYVLGLAVDGNNNIWAVGDVEIAAFNNTGTPLSGSPYGAGIDGLNGAIAVDASNDIWVEGAGNGNVVELNNSGSQLTSSGTDLDNPVPNAAIDGSGQFWAPLTTASSGLMLFSSSDVQINYFNSIGSLTLPTSVSIDGAGHIWTANTGTNPENVTEMFASGSPLSPPDTGYAGVGPAMNQAGANQMDASGNLWVVDTADNSFVTEFVGIGAPTVTPLAAAVANKQIGQRP
jgi:hypothetical protein